jgi:hypothetical protein
MSFRMVPAQSGNHAKEIKLCMNIVRWPRFFGILPEGLSIQCTELNLKPTGMCLDLSDGEFNESASLRYAEQCTRLLVVHASVIYLPIVLWLDDRQEGMNFLTSTPGRHILRQRHAACRRFPSSPARQERCGKGRCD